MSQGTKEIRVKASDFNPIREMVGTNTKTREYIYETRGITLKELLNHDTIINDLAGSPDNSAELEALAKANNIPVDSLKNNIDKPLAEIFGDKEIILPLSTVKTGVRTERGGKFTRFEEEVGIFDTADLQRILTKEAIAKPEIQTALAEAGEETIESKKAAIAASKAAEKQYVENLGHQYNKKPTEVAKGEASPTVEQTASEQSEETQRTEQPTKPKQDEGKKEKNQGTMTASDSSSTQLEATAQTVSQTKETQEQQQETAVAELKLKGQTVAPKGSINRNNKLEQHKEDVMALKKTLMALGYNNVGTSDVFNQATYEAVKDIQRKQHFEIEDIDGIVGKKTLIAINNAAATLKANGTSTTAEIGQDQQLQDTQSRIVANGQKQNNGWGKRGGSQLT